MKLLMHTCCAPCSVYCIDSLRKEGIEPTLYWYNPNIHPYIEYKTRKETLEKYSEMINIKTIYEEEYGLQEFCKKVCGNLEKRCEQYCYPVRLNKTAQYAKEHGYTAITTTLLVSPYQKHDIIKRQAEKIAQNYGLEFVYRDFRIGFKEGQAKARELGLYMQKYCGCVFSEESRYLSSNHQKPQLPEGFEFIKPNPLEVKRIENKEEYMDLLLEGDPSKKAISKYLQDSDVYGFKKDGEIISIAVIVHIDRNTIELKNIVTKEEYRNKGYTKRFLKSLCGNYKQKYTTMLVGTTGKNIPFFVKQGFENYEKTIKTFFSDDYETKIKCNDLIYYSKNLKNNNKKI